jgi:biopolymer transport protein TolR
MSDINMTPLIDVMLVLVVIFIITAPLLVTAVKVDLPRTAAAAALDAPQFIALTIARNGQAYVDELPMDAAALAATLRQAAQRHPDTEVRLRADNRVPYGRVVEVMGLAHQAGLHRIGFVAQTTPGAN